MKMIDDVIIIGIDSGYGNIKTANCCFPASVSAYDKEPVFKENLLVYLMRTKVASWISSKASNDINLEPISAIFIHRGINLEPHEQGYFLRSVR